MTTRTNARPDTKPVLSAYTDGNGHTWALLATPVLALNHIHLDILEAADKRRRYQPDFTNDMVTMCLHELGTHGLIAGNRTTDLGRQALRIVGRLK